MITDLNIKLGVLNIIYFPPKYVTASMDHKNLPVCLTH